MLFKFKYEFFKGADTISDFLLMLLAYNVAHTKDLEDIANNIDLQLHYKVAFISFFIASTIQFLILYSSSLISLWKQGIFEPARFKLLPWYLRTYYTLYMTVLALPLTLFVELSDMGITVAQFFCVFIDCCFGTKLYQRLDNLSI